MSYPAHLKYTDQHEWIRVEGDIAVIGITHHAQDQLGDIVHVELPAVGKTLKKGATACEVESVKAVSDVYAPVSGTVTEVNAALDGDEAVINRDPHDGGWLFKVRLTNQAELAGLMDAATYGAIADADHH
jgi:glycine cleavage system H protein